MKTPPSETGHLLRRALTHLGEMAAKPVAFVMVGLYGALWAIFAPGDMGWHGVATLATLVVALLVQRAEHRDTQALHAKLDELLRLHAQARSGIAHIDKAEPEEIEAHRDRARHSD